MGIVVDLIIILILGLCIFNGYKKGLAKSLLKLLTSLIAIIIAIVLYKPFVNFVIERTMIDDNIKFSLEKIINQNTDHENEDLVNEESGIPKPIANYLNNNIKQSAETQKEAAISESSKAAAELIINAACVVIIYIIAKILLKIITLFIDIFASLPVIKQFNELGGIIYGIIEGIVILLIIVTLISVITPLIGNYEIPNMILDSHIGKFLYNNNIFLNLIF